MISRIYPKNRSCTGGILNQAGLCTTPIFDPIMTHLGQGTSRSKPSQTFHYPICLECSPKSLEFRGISRLIPANSVRRVPADEFSGVRAGAGKRVPDCFGPVLRSTSRRFKIGPLLICRTKGPWRLCAAARASWLWKAERQNVGGRFQAGPAISAPSTGRSNSGVRPHAPHTKTVWSLKSEKGPAARTTTPPDCCSTQTERAHDCCVPSYEGLARPMLSVFSRQVAIGLWVIQKAL